MYLSIPALIADAITEVTRWQQIPALEATVVLPGIYFTAGGKRGTVDTCDIKLYIVLAVLGLFVFCLVGKSLGNCICQFILWVISTSAS